MLMNSSFQCFRKQVIWFCLTCFKILTISSNKIVPPTNSQGASLAVFTVFSIRKKKIVTNYYVHNGNVFINCCTCMNVLDGLECSVTALKNNFDYFCDRLCLTWV